MSKIRVGKIEKLDGNAPTLADLGIIGNGDSNGHVSGLTDLVDVDFSIPPVENQILSYDSASSFWKPVDLNYTVTLEDVTQYQSNLQITEGQITDLQTYLTSVAFSDLTSTPSTITGYGITDAFDGNYSSLSNIPSFATVATSGSFTDLLNKPGLGNLTDVTTTGVTTGQILKWSGTQWQPANDTVGEDGLDSASAITLITNTVDSAYVQARETAQDFAYSSLTGAPNVLDSADVATIAGGLSGLDSTGVINLVDSAYVQARETPQDFTYASLTGVPNVLDSTDVINLVDSAYVQARQVISSRNLIINGAMDFDQRYSGTAHTMPAYTNTYVLDRWFGKAQPTASKFSVQQVAASGDALASGFEKCSEISSLTTHTQTSGDIYSYMHSIEGLYSKHLQWGTGNAKTVTMSFWVKSSKTGTHGGSFLDASNAYTYPFSYSVSSANTWEQKTVTLTGPTSGTFNKTNAVGLQISFGLSVGSSFSGTAGSWSGTANIFGSTGAVNVLDSSSNTWSITGVQLEVGSVATPFEHRSYGEELALCQRYFHRSISGTIIGAYIDTNRIDATIHFPTTMRATPTMTASSGTNYWYAYTGGSPDYFNAWSGAGGASVNNGSIYVSSGEISGPDNAGCQIAFVDANSYFQADAEL